MSSLSDPDRLAALERSGLLLKGAGERFHHVCYSVVQLLRCDASMLNVITASQQIFVAEYPPSVVERVPVPVEDSGCREVVLARNTLVIPNTREHPIMCVRKWTQEWGGYLGTPVHFDGHIIGSLCALSHQPREWTHHDKLAIETFGALVADSMRAYTPGPTWYETGQ